MSALHAIGIDIGGTLVKLGVVDERAIIKFRQTIPVNRAPERLVRELCSTIKLARSRYTDAPVGIACAGRVVDGVVSADNLGWNKVPLRALLEWELGGPAPLGNDAHLAMMTEWRYGALKGCRHGIYITLGTGVGGGVIANGSPFAGSNGVGAELGHMITHAGGLPCTCGHEGCYEMYAAASALTRMAGGLPVKETINSIRAGNYADVWQSYLREVCIGLVSYMAIFAPEVIAIGGGLSSAGRMFEDGLNEALRTTPGYTRLHQHIKVKLGTFGNDAGIIGAAELALQ